MGRRSRPRLSACVVSSSRPESIRKLAGRAVNDVTSRELVVWEQETVRARIFTFMDHDVEPERVTGPAVPVSADLSDEDVVLLPREIDDNGIALYDDSVITVAKDLREYGATARFQHPADERSFIGERGATPVLLNLVITVGTKVGWAAVKAYLERQRSSDRVRVTVCKIDKSDAGTSFRWYKAEGPGAGVATAIAQIESSEDDVTKRETPPPPD